MAIRSIQCPPSTNIASVDYDDETSTLYVQFHTHGKGSQYAYSQVPAQVAEGFTTSGLRANAYFNQTILNQYQHQRMG